MKINNISNNYYVGNLNWAFEMPQNLLAPSKLSKKQYQEKQLYEMTINNGAIKLNNVLGLDKIDWEKRLNYETLLTIFYKLDDYNYLCLHNGITYNSNGLSYFDDLVSLEDLLPKIDYDYPDKLNKNKALTLFNILFTIIHLLVLTIFTKEDLICVMNN